MIAEIGHYAMVMALGFSILLAIYPMWGAVRNDVRMMATATPLAFGMFVFTAVAFAALVNAFIEMDFTLQYVAQHTSTQTPLYYRITAVWGAHEGSFLLWCLILAGWTLAVAIFNRAMPHDLTARALSVLGFVSIGFYFFMIVLSNPFDRVLPNFPVEGRDLNPLLQDFGMIYHPPMLYMGYVGFAVVFAYAVAALLKGQLDSVWAKYSRPWTLAAWVFLTVGIVLGSWWAYYELGWGGWWFWDPVENASFMPWLVGTALIHSLAVSEKRNVFKSWSVLLAIAAFSLSLLGTFLVRSGVIVSVHAFASDPSRGLFILGLLILVVGGSLLLYALRVGSVKNTSSFNLISRESLMLTNNIFLSTATVVVLLGTLLPLVHKEIGLGTISIGVPFFNQMFVMLIVPFVFFMGIGPLSRWKQQPAVQLKNKLLVAFAFSITMAFIIPVLLFSEQYPVSYSMVILGLALSFWLVVTTIQEIQLRTYKQTDFVAGLQKLTPNHWGMVLGHLGLAVSIIGITLVQNYSLERDVRMSSGDVIELAGYQFTFNGVEPIQGPNYSGHKGILNVTRKGADVAVLKAEKRFYTITKMVMTEAAIDAGVTRDLYAALGEQMNNGDWALRIYYRPFVRWIWVGGIFMALGGICCMLDKRYRLKRPVKSESDQAVPVV